MDLVRFSCVGRTRLGDLIIKVEVVFMVHSFIYKLLVPSIERNCFIIFNVNSTASIENYFKLVKKYSGSATKSIYGFGDFGEGSELYNCTAA